MFTRKKQEPARQPNLMEGQTNDYTFRRSRTLTGTASKSVVATAEKRGQLKTDRLKIHELHAVRRRVVRLLSICLIAGVGLLLLLVHHLGSPNLTYPQTSKGIGSPDTSAYLATIKDYLARHPLEQFSFSLNRPTFVSFMQQKHPEISGITVHSTIFGGDQNFYFVFREPLLVWDAPSGRFFVDGSGSAFTKNYFSSDGLVHVVDKSGVTPDSGSTIASQRFIRFLGQVVSGVNDGDKGKVTTVSIPASTREIDLRLEGREYDIRTHIDRDPNHQAEDVINALTFFDNRKVKPQYIDARVANRAFYR